MKPYFSIIVFACFCAASTVSGYKGYADTKSRLSEDLTVALTRALAHNGGNATALDTIKACSRLAEATGGPVEVNASDASVRRFVKSETLRKRTYLRCSVGANGQETKDGIRSDTIYLGVGGRRMAVSSYAKCTRAEVFGMSDQRLSVLLFAAGCLWMMVARTAFRKREQVCEDGERQPPVMESYGVDKSRLCLTVAGKAGTELTPMQCRLMELFLASPDHCLTKDEICRELWPKKDNANETLYALVRRLRVVLAANTGLKIDTGKSGTYELKGQVP